MSYEPATPSEGKALRGTPIPESTCGVFHPRIVFVASAFCCLAAVVLTAGDAHAPAAPLKLHYHLRVRHPTTHILEVEIDAGQVIEPALDFSMPAWSPGRYAL